MQYVCNIHNQYCLRNTTMIQVKLEKEREKKYKPPKKKKRIQLP